jgi:rhodanese-related sulfurtransferase
MADDDISRIGALAVRDMLQRGEHVVFVDARSCDAWQRSDVQLPGAIRVPPDDVAAHRDQIPHDSAVITYCTCPHEESSAAVARQLSDWGWSRAEPLAGGMDEWVREGLPTVPKAA